jgi:hypothetical protein
MKRRFYLIYGRKTRQAVSCLFGSRKMALDTLRDLNCYCGKKRYCLQTLWMKKKKLVKRYPDIELRPLPERTVVNAD